MKNKYSKIKSLLSYIKNKKPELSGLIISFGKRGSGKSTLIAKAYLKYINKDHKLYQNFYSNITIYDSNFEFKNNYLDLTTHKLTDYLDPNDPTIKKYKCSTFNSIDPVPFFISHNSIVCLDELGILAHARDYKNFPKEIIYFMKIIRKLGILIIANSQSYDIDKAIRQSASELRIIKKIGNLSISRKLEKDIDIAESKETAESQVVDKLEFSYIFKKDAIKFCYIPFYTNLFNSFE